MNNYCQCKTPDMDVDDKGQQFCVKCLKEIEMSDPDLDRDYEAQEEEKLSDEGYGSYKDFEESEGKI